MPGGSRRPTINAIRLAILLNALIDNWDLSTFRPRF